MRLSPEDVDLFYKLYFSLLLFASERLQIGELGSVADVAQMDINERLELRDALFKNHDLIAEFVSAKPSEFSQQELEIVSSWKRFLKGRFYLFKQLKKHAIFLTFGDDMKAYGVLAIADLFEDLVPFMPIIAHPVLLPFKGQIIYDGLLPTESIFFGSGIKRRLTDEYNQAKAKYGIITSLEDAPRQAQKPDETELLKFYLRSERNQEEYWDEIQRLIKKSEANRITYFQEIGKYSARGYGRRLRELGIESGWFGILENVVIGSGKTRKEAENNVAAIVTKKQMNHVYFFQLKSKKSS